jgi:ATP-dependent helicase HrpB
LLVAVVIEPARRGGRNDLEVPVAVPLEPAWLPARETLETRWDPQRLAVIQRRVRRYGAVEVGERPAGDAADPLAAAMLLREQAAREPDRALSLDDDALALLGRIRWLAAVRPELELPRWDPIGAEAVGDRFDLLGALCVGRRSFDELRRAPVASVALSLLEWPQRQALDAQAPERLPLPSGRSGRVRYTPGEPPRLSLRLQDAFGMVETPRVAGGRVPVVVELLAPNNRPAQVTADIGGFWTSSWPEVRRELRGRYPKHAWPERPTAADARPPGRGR